ncbi:hypothetical protein [Streptomyces albospinus]|nr:hypothetical protein [Streptomyces albospinus]
MERIGRQFAVLATEFTVPGGEIVLPHTVLPVSGRVAGPAS